MPEPANHFDAPHPTAEAMNTDPDTALLRAIAEDAGWKRTRLECHPCMEDESRGIVYCKWEHPVHRPVDDEPGFDPAHMELAIPDYLTDRDAIMELVLGLDESDQERFAILLYQQEHIECLREDEDTNWRCIVQLITATARQLAMAYARTKGITPSTE